MSLAATLSLHARHAADLYNDKTKGRLERAFIARASFVDSTIVSTGDLFSRVINFAYEFFRSLTVGVLFLREAPRTRLIESGEGVLSNLGEIALGILGIVCPHLVVRTKKWIDTPSPAFKA